MAKKKTTKKKQTISGRSQRIVLGTVIVGSLAILAGMVLILPSRDSSPIGIGSDGFSAFVKNGTDIGVSKVASKDVVAKAVGNNIKAVADVESSKVFSLNGNLGQTATYPVTLKDGATGSIAIDVWKYKSQEALDSDDIFKGTGAAGTINGREVRYAPATTLGNERSYTLITKDGTSVYRFIFAQPSSKIQVKEYKAQDILKEIISKSKF